MKRRIGQNVFGPSERAVRAAQRAELEKEVEKKADELTAARLNEIGVRRLIDGPNGSVAQLAASAAHVRSVARTSMTSGFPDFASKAVLLDRRPHYVPKRASKDGWFMRKLGPVFDNPLDGETRVLDLGFDHDLAWERVFGGRDVHEVALGSIEEGKEFFKRQREELTERHPYWERFAGYMMDYLGRLAKIADAKDAHPEMLRALLLAATVEFELESLIHWRFKNPAVFATLSDEDVEREHGSYGFTHTSNGMSEECLGWVRDAPSDVPLHLTHEIWIRAVLDDVAHPMTASSIIQMCDASEKASKALVTPPAGSAANAEVGLMQVGYWGTAVSEVGAECSVGLINVGTLLDKYVVLAKVGVVHIPRVVFSAVAAVAPVRSDGGPYPHEDGVDDEEAATRLRGAIRIWSLLWRKAGFARLDVSHKLAASLMLTDAKGLAVKSPWEAFSLHIPPGITRVSRLLCTTDGDGCVDPYAVIFEDGTFGDFTAAHLTPPELDLLENFARGACIAVEQGHAKLEGKHGVSSAKGKRGLKGPPIAGERYQLAAPVKVDLREVVREHLSGARRGGSPKVQFVVRGHWRNQAHGPGMKQHRRMWIEPYWKGPEDSRVLLRGYEVEGDAVDPKAAP